MAGTTTRRRGDAEETRRRVLDAVVATVVDVGYYKASSNEIARHAGVTWGTIQHLFGSREQLMLDVVNDFGGQMALGFANTPVEGGTLEERIDAVFDVLRDGAEVQVGKFRLTFYRSRLDLEPRA